MSSGLPPGARRLDRATLARLLDSAAPRPLPAHRAIALLQRLDEADPTTFGRLAYRALTGVEPGADPRPPAEVVPGFPPFAAEVLLRAVTGAGERRPAPAALLIVLETVPAAAWPKVAEVEIEPVEIEPVEIEPVEIEPVEIEPVEIEAVVPDEPADVPVDMPPLDEGETPTRPVTTPTSTERGRWERRGRRHGAARRNTGPGAGSRAAQYTSKEDRKQTLLVVALLVVLIAVGALYAAFHDSGTSPTEDETASHGASRTISQPFEVRR